MHSENRFASELWTLGLMGREKGGKTEREKERRNDNEKWLRRYEVNCKQHDTIWYDNFYWESTLQLTRFFRVLRGGFIATALMPLLPFCAGAPLTIHYLRSLYDSIRIYAFKFRINIHQSHNKIYIASMFVCTFYSFISTIKRAVSELRCVCELVTTRGFMFWREREWKKLLICMRSLTLWCYSCF